MKTSNPFLAAVMLAAFFAVPSANALSEIQATAIKNSFLNVAPPESALRAAEIVARASKVDRKAVAVEAVRAIVSKTPTAAPMVVGAISKVAPATAPAIAAAAAKLAPDELEAIARSAALAAPSFADSIVRAMAEASPASIELIANVVSGAVPTAHASINQFVRVVRNNAAGPATGGIVISTPGQFNGPNQNTPAPQQSIVLDPTKRRQYSSP